MQQSKSIPYKITSVCIFKEKNISNLLNLLLTLKVCVRYFSPFLKDKCFFERSTLKRNLTYSCFFFPLFHEHLFSPGLPRATRLLETSWLEKITVCVIETMLVTLPLVQMNKARREVNQTNHIQTKIKSWKVFKPLLHT